MNPILFAQETVDTAKVLASYRSLDPPTRERLVIFGAIGLVTLLVVLWAIFLRRRRRRRREHHHSHHQSPPPAEVVEALTGQDAAARPYKRRRRRRSSHSLRPRNPTLAQTGGLPPVRPEGPPEPQP
jgi:type VI protein secretion system component VasK